VNIACATRQNAATSRITASDYNATPSRRDNYWDSHPATVVSRRRDGGRVPSESLIYYIVLYYVCITTFSLLRVSFFVLFMFCSKGTRAAACFFCFFWKSDVECYLNFFVKHFFILFKQLYNSLRHSTVTQYIIIVLWTCYGETSV